MDDGNHVSFNDDPFLFTLYLCISAGLTCMAGLMSGLTLGLMSLDATQLEVLRRTGTPEEMKYASIIMPVIKNQHLLLVTLLLCNACPSEALPLFLDRLADSSCLSLWFSFLGRSFLRRFAQDMVSLSGPTLLGLSTY